MYDDLCTIYGHIWIYLTKFDLISLLSGNNKPRRETGFGERFFVFSMLYNSKNEYYSNAALNFGISSFLGINEALKKVIIQLSFVFTK